MTTVNRARRLALQCLAYAGLPLLLWANYFLLHTLEEGDKYIYSFLPFFYRDGERAVFSPSFPIWKLFLPLREITGTWTTSSLILTHIIELHIGAANTWYLLNAVLIVVSFVTARLAFRSNVFGYTVAICMGFGTQLYHTHAVTGTVAACLLLSYYQVTALVAWRVIEGRSPRWAWKVGFLACLLVTAVSYEGWLDLLVFGWLACGLVAYLDWRHGRSLRSGLLFAIVTSTIVGVAYVVIKTRLGYAQTPGGESDVVFNYQALAPAIEDVASNIVANAYLAISNFLPPSLVTSTAFFQLGGDQLVAMQRNYHPAYSYLVVMQSLFLWRYAAGAFFALFVYGLIRLVSRLRHEWSTHHLTLALFMLMTMTGGPTHALVKARPMHSMPLLGYHVLVGIVGASCLIAYLLMKGIQGRGRLVSVALVTAVWGVLFYGAIARPAMLIHEAAQVGFGERIYPNPKESLAVMLGFKNTTPLGFETYRLMKYSVPGAQPALAATPAPVPVTYPAGFDHRLPPLPGNVISFDQWRAYPGVTLTSTADGGFLVMGAATAGGYGYQLQSPPVPVPPHRRVLFRLNGTMESGRACFGVLSEDNKGWLLAPNGSQPEYGLETGENRVLVLVIADCSGTVKPVAPVFTLDKSMTFATMDAPPANTAQQ